MGKFIQNIVSERFVEVFECLKSKGIISTNKEFADKIDYLPQSLGEILAGRRDVTIDVIRKLIIVYNINPDFIFMGTDSIFRTKTIIEDKKNTLLNTLLNTPPLDKIEEKSVTESVTKTPEADKKSISESISKSISEASKNDKKNGAEPTPIIYGNRISDTAVPFYDLPVSAGPLGIIELGNERTEAGYIDIPIFRGCERILPVMGVSMEPVIFSGDLVGIRTIPNLSERWDFLQTGKVYLIITREDRMIKYLQESADNKDYIVCYSPNCSPFKVFKGDILQLFRVVAVARGLN